MSPEEATFHVSFDPAHAIEAARAEVERLNADLSALMSAFNDQAAENERLTKQRDFAQEGWAKAEATIERLRAALRTAQNIMVERGATVERLRAFWNTTDEFPLDLANGEQANAWDALCDALNEGSSE